MWALISQCSSSFSLQVANESDAIVLKFGLTLQQIMDVVSLLLFINNYYDQWWSMMIVIDVNQTKCFASFACLEKWLWMTLGRPTKWNWINVYFMMIIDRLWWWCWWLSVITAHMSLHSKVKTFCFSGREESAFDNKPLAQPGEFLRQTASPQ